MENYRNLNKIESFSAYTDNEFDVAGLMEEADLKAQAEEQVNNLEDEVGRLKERIQELEVNTIINWTFIQFF